MACHTYGNAIVCGPAARDLRKRYLRCPTCECTTEMVAQYQNWYGVDAMCCRCGDSWSNGELQPRPFYPRWRSEAARRHRRLWDLAVFGPPPDFAARWTE